MMIIKANALIQGAIKAANELDFELVSKTIIPMIESVWQKIILILQKRFHDKLTITSTCQLINKSVSVICKQI